MKDNIFVLRIGCGCCCSSTVYKSERAALAAMSRCRARDPYWNMLLCNVHETGKGRFEGFGYYNGAAYDLMLDEISCFGGIEKLLGREILLTRERRFCASSILRGWTDAQIAAYLKSQAEGEK